MAVLGLPGPPFFFCIFFLFITVPTITKSAMNDAEALLKIKQSLHDSQFLDSWKNGTQPCDEVIRWVGVVCGKGIVTTLRLRSMNLSGDIDMSALSQLQGLRVLNLVNNSFSGPIPEFNKLGALKAIYVSMNNFSGEIPSGFFTKMVSLKKIWFDKNNFTGPIPSSLAQLPRLLELHLNSNNFTGLIPSIGQQSLESLNLSSNNLYGDIPSSLSRFDVSCFEGNPGLCGQKFGKLCASVVPTPPPPSEPPQKSLKIAYALMGLSGFILASMLVGIYLLVQKRKREERDQMCTEKRNFDGNIGLCISSIGRKEEDGSGSGTGKCMGGRRSPRKTKGFGDLMMLNNTGKPVFGLSDLMKAGAEVLGNGSLGSSYKAKLSNGLILVVKRLKEMNKMDSDDFKTEMTRLGGLKHPNILAPLACHYQKDEKLLIYEYIPKGSLLYLLHGDRGESHANLNWPTRLKIIQGIVLGMSYIHTELATLALPHGNLKSSNVLIGPDNEPLVVDYGLISIIERNHAASVLMGYQAPEAVESRSISPKCDVYSLGVIVLEILTGKFPSQYHKNNKGGTDVVRWVKSAIEEKREVELLDPGISEHRSCIGEMQKLLHIGADCTESNPEKRVDIREAIRRIDEIRIDGST
ncbi:pollen receptor-like kinase 3 [Cynara cardunculus var. scolymus]|uniref:Leucine-rich repeat-containing protein n=1 Tax=Cynara cardunculus var. scolymus TaxID=59895 RepID=A0A124SGB0_CYNCS|nr:pollen receptor-like kinase 3 [Cynara cardunculus var. scolymus]KVI05822.1 Leucine-rich repeat-containing protein [Cynara cardunculus var. scolymus]